MILDRVTITGADDSVHPSALIDLSKRYPFVEWGILLSRSREGGPRFPSSEWLHHLIEVQAIMGRVRHFDDEAVRAGKREPGTQRGGSLKLSGHLCGQWVRALCRGSNRFITERPQLFDLFQRVQLNFHAQPHEVLANDLASQLKKWGREQYILQVDGVNDELVGVLVTAGVNVAPLFDLSGGAGVSPESWPTPAREYSGYAGGLHPDIIRHQLGAIALAAGDARVWVDVETHVRSEYDTVFDLGKVEQFLAVCEPWVAR